MRTVRFLMLILGLVMSVAVLAQGKKGKGKQAPVEDTVSQQDTTATRPLTASEILTQHYIRKYSLAVQWNDYTVAKSALYDVIIENPENDSLIFDLAYYYFQNQEYTSAALISQELLKRNPKDLASLEISANSLEGLGALDKSLEQFQSIYLLENDPTVLYRMAFLQYRLKRYAESTTSIEILMENPLSDSLQVAFNDASGKPKDYSVEVALLNLKGLIAKEQNNLGEARKQFTLALEKAPDFAPAKVNLDELE